MEYYLLYAICCTSRFPKPKVRYDVETISPLLTIVVLFKLELTCILILLLLVFIRNGINEPAEVLPFYGSIFMLMVFGVLTLLLLDSRISAKI